MKYMQIVRAQNVELARRSYVDMLQRQGVALLPAAEVFCETVHRPTQLGNTWLCYIGSAGQRAA